MYSRSDIAFRLCGTCSGAGSRSLLAYRLQKLVLKAKPTGSEWKCYSSAPSGSEKLVSRGEVDDDREAGHEAGDNGDSDRLIRLPPPKDVKIKTAKYVTSSVTLSQCPPPKLPEFAVIGRSNVGKSSLINMLTGSKSLALTSKQPGAHTQTTLAFRLLFLSLNRSRRVLKGLVLQGRHVPLIIF